jgi:hypothetical protein
MQHMTPEQVKKVVNYLNRTPDLIHDAGLLETFAKTNELRFVNKLIYDAKGKPKKQRVLQQMEISSLEATRWINVPFFEEHEL